MNKHNKEIQYLHLNYLNSWRSQTDLYIKYCSILGESSLAHKNISNTFNKKGNMEIGQYFTVEFESEDLKMWIILAVLKHSGKIPSDLELLKSIETIGEISGFVIDRSVDLL